MVQSSEHVGAGKELSKPNSQRMYWFTTQPIRSMQNWA
jgi:hypothetical protein